MPVFRCRPLPDAARALNVVHANSRQAVVRSDQLGQRMISKGTALGCRRKRATFGSSAFNGVLAAAAADVTLRRAVAFDLTLPFLGAALLVFRDFAMERVDMGFGLRWFAASELTF